MISDISLEEIFDNGILSDFDNEILSDENIRTLYEKIISLIENHSLISILKKKLIDEYFEDLIVESLPYKSINILNCEL
jgi:hypothetical protein